MAPGVAPEMAPGFKAASTETGSLVPTTGTRSKFGTRCDRISQIVLQKYNSPKRTHYAPG